MVFESLKHQKILVFIILVIKQLLFDVYILVFETLKLIFKATILVFKDS